MYNMPARKIPLVWKTQKESEQTLLKYNPATRRVVQIGCGCPCSGLPVGDFTLFYWDLVGVEPFWIQAFWSPSANAISYTLNFLLSDTYPLSSSNISLSVPNVNSGDLIPVDTAFVNSLNCNVFGVQILAIGKCDSKSSNISSNQFLNLQKCVAPDTASLIFGVSDLTISFSDGINVNDYEIVLYDVTASSYPLYNPIIDDIVTNTSPFVIPYSSLISSGASNPILVTGHEYQLIIYVSNNPSGGPCVDIRTYSPVLFDRVFPTPVFQYTRVGGGIGDPGTGNFSIVPTSLPNVVVQFNNTDSNSQDATTWLSTQLAICNHIKIQKDLSNYVVVTRNVSNEFGTFWAFDSTIFLSAGIVNSGDVVTVTYD